MLSQMYVSRYFIVLLLAFPAYAQAQITLNECLAANNSVNQDPDFQDFADWVEIYNGSATAVDLGGWWLSDDADVLDKWIFPVGTTIPAQGFLLVWTDGRNTGLHTNFKLSAAGEKIILSDAQGTELDKFSFGPEVSNVSQGRQMDGAGPWGFFTQPTPGASNQTSQFFIDYIKTLPFFSKNGGFYAGPVALEIKNLSSTGEVHYTLDGSEPTAASPVWSQTQTYAANTVVKARITAAGRIPGPIVTNSYFVGEDFQQRGLAVLSLTGNPDDFYGPDSGILVQNYKPLWEIPVHLEFFENDGIAGFQHDAGAAVGGENSWLLPQKMLNISSRKQYGGGHIEYQIFPEIARTRFEDLILRTSGNDWSNTLFRDGMMQNTAGSTSDLDIQAFRPVAAFINGQYYGIYNLREKQDKEYAAIHRGVANDSLDYIENNAEVKEGDAVAYQQMVALLDAGLQSAPAFQNLAKNCDVRNFTDYIIAEIFTANTSWGHNIALYRSRSPEGKWRWFPHDFDRGFNLSEVNGTGMNWATATNGLDYSNPPFATLFLRKMLENEAFKDSFITRFADHLYVTWNPLWVFPRIDRYAGWIKNEVPYHVGMWTGTTSAYGNGIASVAFWQDEVLRLKNFGSQRSTFMFNDLVQFFGLPGVSGLTVAVSDPAQGRVRLHDLPLLPQYPWTGKYFQNRPFTLTAVARPGFQFVRWEKIQDSAAVFIPAGSSWKYYAEATTPPAAWLTAGFNDAGWPAGPAQLGYGDGDEATALPFGSDPNNKILTYYFRKNFTVNDPATINQLLLRLVADDGAVVYLNGAEVWRQNMPAGPIDFQTLATTALSGTAENAWNELSVPASSLTAGENTLAVEVHQAAGNSSDLSFDFALNSVSGSIAQIVGTQAALTTSISSPDPVSYRAVFESDGNCGILPDTVRQNLSLTAACSPYTAAGDVVVLPNVSLTIAEGVEIRFPEGANLWVLGDLQINGLADAPVRMTGLPGTNAWGAILLKNTTAKSTLRYLNLENASAGLHRLYFPAAISAYHADLDMDHLGLTNVLDNPVFARFSNIVMTNSHVRSVVTGDGINVKQGQGRVENCRFTALGTMLPDMDAIDFDGVTDGIIRNNIVHDFRGDNCDGLDIGEQCQNLLIEGNFIYHCFDKGISVGQQSSGLIRNNTIAYTTIGIALKDQSPVTVDHCTLFGNQSGVSAYEKNPGSLGGNGIITNCIVSNAAFDAYIADSLSSLSLSNCLSDPDTLTGNGNLTTDPKFVNPTLYDFHLLANSPARGVGTNGSDLGADPLPVYAGQPQVMLSEILYHDTLTATGEFLEIHNPGTETVDLEGYTLAGAVDFVFPAGAELSPGGYLVVAKNSGDFPANVPYPLFQWTTGKLSDAGEKILLFDATGLLADFVRYNNHSPWPEGSALLGSSLELVSAGLDNHFASSWQPSGMPGGSPGQPGGVVATFGPAAAFLEMALFPNPARDVVQLAIKNAPAETLLLQMMDMHGRLVFAEKLDGLQHLQQAQLELGTLANGIYQVRVLDKQGAVLGCEGLLVGH